MKTNNDELNNEKPFLRSAYNYNTDLVSLANGTVSDSETLTQQHQADQTDINYIVRQFGITGQLPQTSNPPTYQDFSESVYDYQTALNMIRDADNTFNALPAETRAHFANDPGKYLEFFENPDPQTIEKLNLGKLFTKDEDSTVPPT